jgi:hypothetical protein
MLNPQKLMSTKGGIQARRERLYELVNESYQYPSDDQATRLKDQAYEQVKELDESGGESACWSLNQAEEKIAEAIRILRANKKKLPKRQTNRR